MFSGQSYVGAAGVSGRKTATVDFGLSSGVLATGLTYEPLRRLFDYVKAQFISKSRFYELQRRFAIPAVDMVYKKRQRAIIEERKADPTPIIVAGTL